MTTEVGLVYRGKKAPLTIENSRLSAPVKFPNNKKVIWTPKSDADLLMKENPKMFAKAGERMVDEEIVAQESVVEEPKKIEEEHPVVKKTAKTITRKLMGKEKEDENASEDT
jgi:hypothetical protein